MNCTEIKELTPLWHSCELDASRQRAFDAHLAACPDCAAEIREQWNDDERLRQAITAESADTAPLEQRVIDRIARERRQRWFVLPGVAVAAAAVIAVFLLRAPVTSAPASPAVFADAARDHTAEVIRQSPRRWQTDPAAIATLAAGQGLSGSDVKALETTGYKLERAKICHLSGTPYMHLVYTKDGRELSVFMRVRGGQAIPETAASEGTLQLASFARSGVQAIVVTDAPRGECAKFTREAEAAL
jgi:anti-sigma factor RsiW